MKAAEKVFKVNNRETGLHEFNIYVSSNNKFDRYLLESANNTEVWTPSFAGTKLIEIKDDGNGLKINDMSNRRYYSYDEFLYLHILINFIVQYQENLCERYEIQLEDKNYVINI